MEVGVLRGDPLGGVPGRRVRLIALDDGYEPARAAPNLHTLIEREHVLAVVGNVAPPHTQMMSLFESV